MAESRNNKLTLPQTFQVSKFLHTIEERLKEEGPSRPLAAKWASEALGFEVTQQNLISIAAADGIEWAVKVVRPKGYKNGSRIDTLTALLDALSAKFHDSLAAGQRTVDALEKIGADLEKRVNALENEVSARLLAIDKKFREMDAGIAWVIFNMKMLAQKAGVSLHFSIDMKAVADLLAKRSAYIG